MGDNRNSYLVNALLDNYEEPLDIRKTVSTVIKGNRNSNNNNDSSSKENNMGWSNINSKINIKNININSKKNNINSNGGDDSINNKQKQASNDNNSISNNNNNSTSKETNINSSNINNKIRKTAFIIRDSVVKKIDGYYLLALSIKDIL